MARLFSRFCCAALFAACLSLSSPAQEDDPALHARVAPDNVQHDPKVVFALDRTGPGAAPVTLVPADQMSRADQDLLAGAESTIREKAGFESLNFTESGWTHQQIACPALPGHLFVRYSRDDGTRQMSMFSAAIPRQGEGKVRIVPIVRRGYSLFSPAPINALTISSFNHIRAEEDTSQSPDWVGTAMCYAALTGGDPDLRHAETRSSEDPEIAAAMDPTLDWRFDGSASIRFMTTGANGRPMSWAMHFDRKGVLLKAQHAPASLVEVKAAPGAMADRAGK